MLSNLKMRVSIISIIVAILLAASSASPLDTRQPSQLCVMFTGIDGNPFYQCFPPDGEERPFGNYLFYKLQYLHIGWKKTGNFNN